MASTGITVIICSFNGTERLQETISHIAKQEVPSDQQWEVILADNASTDHTAEFGLSEWEKHGLPEISFRVITEQRPGKLFALQKAIEAATYELLIICDDDNWLAPDYVTKVYGILTTKPEVAALGGVGIPVTAGITLPEWFKEYNYAYAVGEQARQTGFLQPRKYLWGAGLATRKSLYQEMYKDFPSLLIDYKNVNILSAEDTEYCLRLLIKGYRLYYDQSLSYSHYIAPQRLETAYREKLLKGFLDSHAVLSKYHTALRTQLKTDGKPWMWLYLFLSSLWIACLSFNQTSRIKAKDTLSYMLGFISSKDPLVNAIKNFIRKPVSNAGSASERL